MLWRVIEKDKDEVRPWSKQALPVALRWQLIRPEKAEAAEVTRHDQVRTLLERSKPPADLWFRSSRLGTSSRRGPFVKHCCCGAIPVETASLLRSDPTGLRQPWCPSAFLIQLYQSPGPTVPALVSWASNGCIAFGLESRASQATRPVGQQDRHTLQPWHRQWKRNAAASPGVPARV
ncbi:uncharacterized protein LOC144172447 [Haemaphysalis longicornis]